MSKDSHMFFVICELMLRVEFGNRGVSEQSNAFAHLQCECVSFFELAYLLIFSGGH